MSRKARARVSSSPAKCPCEAKHWGWKTISGVLLGYSDAANAGTLTATSGDMREAGATTPIRHLSLLIESPCSSKRPAVLHVIGNACKFRRCPDFRCPDFRCPNLEITFFAASAVVV